MKLIFTALIILIGIQNSFSAPVAKMKPASKEYNFYKVGDKYLFKVKDGFMYYGDLMIKKGSHGYFVDSANDNSSSKIEIKFKSASLHMEFIDLQSSNPSETTENQPIIGQPKNLVLKYYGKELPAPEDAISFLPFSMTFEVLNKRGKRLLKENKEFASYIDKFIKCVKKKDIECEMLHEEDDIGVPSSHYPFIRRAVKNINKYITYNYNKGAAISENDLKTSCRFSPRTKGKWVFFCTNSSVWGHKLESYGE